MKYSDLLVILQHTTADTTLHYNNFHLDSSISQEIKKWCRKWKIKMAILFSPPPPQKRRKSLAIILSDSLIKRGGGVGGSNHTRSQKKILKKPQCALGFQHLIGIFITLIFLFFFIFFFSFFRISYVFSLKNQILLKHLPRETEKNFSHALRAIFILCL